MTKKKRKKKAPTVPVQVADAAERWVSSVVLDDTMRQLSSHIVALREQLVANLNHRPELHIHAPGPMVCTRCTSGLGKKKDKECPPCHGTGVVRGGTIDALFRRS